MPATLSRAEVERRTQRIGHAFFDAIEESRPNVLQAEWWEEQFMGQLMQDEWLKVQAFRFIDVVPTLRGGPDIARHLKEYFAAPAAGNGHAAPSGAQAAGPSALARFVPRLMTFERTDGLAARTLSAAVWKAVTTMAHRFIAGQNPEQAERVIRRMRRQQLAFSIDVLGEAALSETEAVHYQETYLHLIRELARSAEAWTPEPLVDAAGGRPVPRVNVSVKLTSLYSQFDAVAGERTKAIIKERLRPLLRAGMERGVHVHVDMEHYAIKDLTLEICREILCEPEFRDYPHFGLVLQAYLRDGDRDVAATVDWVRRRGTPIWVRLVKGAYWDTETVLAEQNHWPCPVWTEKWQSDACYERMTGVLIENHRVIHGAYASHNIRSLSHAMALAELRGLDGQAFELQMLYGMGDPLKRAAVRMGQRCRIYTPYGDMLPGMAYLIRRLLENTANESFVRVSVDASTPREKLLASPERGAVAGGGLAAWTSSGAAASLLSDQAFKDAAMDRFRNVPDTDFAIPDNQQRMLAALATVRGTRGRTLPLVIGGERITTAATTASVNPSRPAEIIAQACDADAALADRAVRVAHDAWHAWRRTSVRERADYLLAVARLMQQRRFELAAMMVLECAKPWREADADVSEAIDFCNFYAVEMIRLNEQPRRRDIPGETNEYCYAPRGVVGVIAPWNFPLAILAGMTTAALVAGNTVVMKPAEQSPAIAWKLMELFEAAGLPPGVLNYLPGPGETVGDALVRHPKVAMIIFTGSRAVGTHINRVAAEILTDQPGVKKVVAEMGGKNATIVDADADLDEAVKGTLFSAFGYAGQKCSAGSRIIVLEAAYARFVERLVEAARSVVVGPAEEAGTLVPPVIDADARERCRKYIEIGRQEARLALAVDVSGLTAASGGYYVGPTIFVDTPPGARIAQEEIFGPITCVIKARDLDEAIAIFNGTDYALTGGIYSRSPASLERARVECECGNLYINRKITGAIVDRQPFGGFKMSGMGSKAGGPDYLLQFVEPRSITENTLRRGFAPTEEVVEALAGAG